MRPRKRILCAIENEQDLSICRFMLETNGYRALMASTIQQTIEVFANDYVDLVLVKFALAEDGDRLIVRLKQIEPHIPMILLADQRQVTSDICHADANIRRQCSAAELLERLKVMCTRKRGQRKGTSRPVQSVQPVVDVELSA